MFEFTQETTKTGHVASFISDAGVSYLWATQFDFDVNIDTVQFTMTEDNFYYSQIDVFFLDAYDSFECNRISADRLISPEDDIADWAEMAFHF